MKINVVICKTFICVKFLKTIFAFYTFIVHFVKMNFKILSRLSKKLLIFKKLKLILKNLKLILNFKL